MVGSDGYTQFRYYGVKFNWMQIIETGFAEYF